MMQHHPPPPPPSSSAYHQQKRQRSADHYMIEEVGQQLNNVNGGDGASTAEQLRQLKSLVGLLVDQVREVKRENADLREEVLDLRVRLQDGEAQHRRDLDDLRRELDRRLERRSTARRFHASSSSGSSTSGGTSHDGWTPSSSGSSSPSSGGSSSLIQVPNGNSPALITATLPFLREYSGLLDPFVINDIRTDAFAAFYAGEPKSVEEFCVNPPVFVYASPACLALTGFSQEDLVGKPIFTLCRTEKEMLFVILTRIFSKPTRLTGEVFTTTMTWATKDRRAIAVRLRQQIFYNLQRQPKWFIVSVESVLDDDAPAPPLSVSDVLHNPGELQRFKAQFSAFFNSLYTTTKTVTTTITTFTGGPPGHAGGGGLPAGSAAAFLGGGGDGSNVGDLRNVSTPASFSSTTTTFASFPRSYPLSMSAAAAAAPSPSSSYLGGSQRGYFLPAPSSPSYSYSSSPSLSSSFDENSAESPGHEQIVTAGAAAAAASSNSQSPLSVLPMPLTPTTTTTNAWSSNVSLAELLEDDECRAILQEQKRKLAENNGVGQQQQQARQQASFLGLSSSQGVGEPSLEELLEEFLPQQSRQPS